MGERPTVCDPTLREASYTLNPSKSFAQVGQETLNLAPFLPFWETGLGDEGHEVANVGYVLGGRLFGQSC